MIKRLLARFLRWVGRRYLPPPPKLRVLTVVLVCDPCVRRHAVVRQPAQIGRIHVETDDNRPCAQCGRPRRLEIEIRESP